MRQAHFEGADRLPEGYSLDKMPVHTRAAARAVSGIRARALQGRETGLMPSEMDLIGVGGPLVNVPVITLPDPNSPLYGAWFEKGEHLELFAADYAPLGHTHIPGATTRGAAIRKGYLWGLPVFIADDQQWANLLLLVLADRAEHEVFLVRAPTL